MINQITITHIFGCCYTVEMGDYFIVFDYSKGIIKIPDDKILIFVVTNSDDSHYTSEILKVPNMEDIIYILNSDIGRLQRNENVIYIKNNKMSIDQIKSLYKSKNVYFVSANNSYSIAYGKAGNINVNTIGSLDKQLDFILNIEGINIFYSSTLKNNEKLDNNDSDFTSYIDNIKEKVDGKIDIGFFSESIDKGRSDRLIRELEPSVFIPQFSDDNDDTDEKFIENHSYDFTDIKYINDKNKEIIIKLNSN